MTKLSFPHSTAYRFPTKKSTIKGCITLLSILSLFLAACQKPRLKDAVQPSKLSTMSDRVALGIQFSDIMAKLPQTVMYELGDSVKFYTGKYESLKTDSTLAIRIPTTQDGNHYVYAVRSFNNPADLKVYLVQFIPDRGSVPERYSGQQIWLDVQDWHIYGTTYKNNIPTQQLTPIQLAEPGWENCMIENGYFSIGDNGNLLVSDNPTVMGGGDCHDPIKPQHPSFFKNLTNTIKDFLSGEGGSNNNWGPGFSVVWNNCGAGAGGPSATGGSGGGGSNTFTPGTLENGPHSLEGNGIPESGNSGITQNTNTAAAYVFYFLSQSGYPLTQPEVNWLVFHNNTDAIKMQQYILGPTQGFTLQEKAAAIKAHIALMTSDIDYNNFINNYKQNNNGNWTWWTNDTWLEPHGGNAFAKWAINYLLQNPTASIQEILDNKNGFDDNQGEVLNDYTEGGYDNTPYPQSPPESNWPTIAPVIPINKFVGWGYTGVPMNCMDYAKAQIAKVGYQISGYFAPGQTLQIYKAQTGVNNNALIQGLSYIKYALSNGIPIIVGVDDKSGSSNTGTDNTTDHFVVVVGMGTDATGKYLQFYDNAAKDVSQGAHSLNRLYYNTTTGQIKGKSYTTYAQNPTHHDYILTMIRKSKHL